ncbi:hypothetical protein BDR26DRAFT_933918 [Obelidium mucronatum]|nr:hypothetical protein BDR26DRAFT_933918 [Obelidium mucronatum]
MAHHSLANVLDLLAEHGLDTKPEASNDQHEARDGFVFVSANSNANAAGDCKFKPVFAKVFLAETLLFDDLLFFVAKESADIFVRRKSATGTLPAGVDEATINWRETFFLNLIVQMHCSLTVSVCKRDSAQQRRTSTLSSEKILSSSTSPPQTADPAIHAIHHRHSPTKSRMVALRRITKKVYAAPYKSRMDVKDAFMNEIAYPLVYYTVNDYESSDLHLHIQEREYLCVELSVLVPGAIQSHLASVGIVAVNDDGEAPDDAKLNEKSVMADSNVFPAPPTVAQDSTPFPVPHGFKKVVLFQGAVPYTALLDVFLQKTSGGGSSASSFSKSAPKSSDWGNLSSANKSGNSLHGGRNSHTQQERTEYIMMRGPRGKGVCQVAICENILSDPVVDSKIDTLSLNSSTAASSSTTSSSILNMLGGTMRTGINILRSGLNAVAGEDSSSPGHPGSQGGANQKKPDALRCSMTYVNVPWHSIISDLFTAREAGTI